MQGELVRLKRRQRTLVYESTAINDLLSTTSCRRKRR